jgi:predicted CXXCH cytochrome family protein
VRRMSRGGKMKGNRGEQMRRPFAVVLLAVAAAVFTGAVAHGQTPNKFKLKPDAAGKVCLGCHDGFKDVLKRQFVHTPVKTGQCAGCHDPHTSDHARLLDDEPGRICLKCHAAIAPQKATSIHKVVAEGNCVRCHDPHGSGNRHNLLKAGNSLCKSCHQDMGAAMAKVKFKHSPAEKDCTGCHDPHASTQSDHLLKKAPTALCLTCHKANNPSFMKQHMEYPVATARCTSCHDPHGSNRDGILYDNVHSPVAKKACTQCHEPANSPTPFKVKKASFELCRGCHNTMMNETFSKNAVHWPVLDKTGCQNCHEPHASPRGKLLKGNGGQVCGRCHGDTMAVQAKLGERERQEAAAAPKGTPIKGALTHKPVQEGNCEACHSPHSADRSLLLKGASAVELCGTCHDWLKHTSHPMGEKTVDQRNRNLKVDCLSCHRAHGTGYRHLIPFPATTDLCVQCHRQYRR